ncbi:MAG: Holliday junction resolvase RuvX [Bacteroidota bacterium]|nr:Holliday junction resolvase RuvX [Bacteroidota bacterium]
MARVVAIDYGSKRVGFAVTDVSQIIATPLCTQKNETALTFLKEYLENEEVAILVVGQPKRWDGSFSEIEKDIKRFIDKIEALKLGVKIVRYDEMFTSKIARQSFVATGLKKKKRENKELLDSTSATIILQDYLSSQGL